MDEVRRKRKEDESEKRLIAHEDYVRIGTGDQCNALGRLSEKMLKMDLLDVAMSQQNAQRNEERLAAGTS